MILLRVQLIEKQFEQERLEN